MMLLCKSCVEIFDVGIFLKVTQKHDIDLRSNLDLLAFEECRRDKFKELIMLMSL